MPLLDHFRPPLSTQRHWESFHTTWASAIADSLNENLQAGLFAEERIYPTARSEIDWGTFDERGVEAGANGAATAVAPLKVPGPSPQWTFFTVFPEGIEVLVFSSEGGPSLAGAIELVSNANKDRPESRRAFAIKCASYLHQGIGLVIVDVVTSRLANLHNEIMRLLDRQAENRILDTAELYVVAYRPLRGRDGDQIDVYRSELAVGHKIPDMPLALGTRLVVPVMLEAAYEDACRRRRL